MPKLPRSGSKENTRSGASPPVATPDAADGKPAAPPGPGPAQKRRAKAAKAATKSRAKGRDFERHPVDEHTSHAPVGPKARLTDDQRVLLGDLFAVVEEHAEEAAEKVDRRLVEAAFVFACDRHAEQRRASGENFIVHPVGVAKICAGMRLDTATLCAALLHDTVEDTSASLDEVQEVFGEEIGALVDGVTKLSGVTFQSRDDRQAENYRKMMVAMAQDIR